MRACEEKEKEKVGDKKTGASNGFSHPKSGLRACMEKEEQKVGDNKTGGIRFLNGFKA